MNGTDRYFRMKEIISKTVEEFVSLKIGAWNSLSGETRVFLWERFLQDRFPENIAKDPSGVYAIIRDFDRYEGHIFNPDMYEILHSEFSEYALDSDDVINQLFEGSRASFEDKYAINDFLNLHKDLYKDILKEMSYEETNLINCVRDDYLSIERQEHNYFMGYEPNEISEFLAERMNLSYVASRDKEDSRYIGEKFEYPIPYLYNNEVLKPCFEDAKTICRDYVVKTVGDYLKRGGENVKAVNDYLDYIAPAMGSIEWKIETINKISKEVVGKQFLMANDVLVEISEAKEKDFYVADNEDFDKDDESLWEMADIGE